jgi:hypothetical protein
VGANASQRSEDRESAAHAASKNTTCITTNIPAGGEGGKATRIFLVAAEVMPTWPTKIALMSPHKWGYTQISLVFLYDVDYLLQRRSEATYQSVATEGLRCIYSLLLM